MDSVQLFKIINQKIDKLTNKALKLVDGGFPWIVVISFHEIYRHIYPFEPHVSGRQIPNNNRPIYLLNLIEKHLKLYDSIQDMVMPYKNVYPQGIFKLF